MRPSAGGGLMAVLYPADSTAWWLGEAPPWECASCAEPVSPPCIFWQGASTAWLLHQACAEHLGGAFLKDSRECELASDPGEHWRRRLITGVRHRLMVEERVA